MLKPLAAGAGRLSREPGQTVEAGVNGSACRMHLAIPDYDKRVMRHYANVAGGYDEACARVPLALEFRHFGLVCEFERPTELSLHDSELVLDDMFREMIASFGMVILRNARLPPGAIAESQRNIFPHLRFHFDRGHNQPRQYSLFFRDPRDAVQAPPRRSSTIVVANVVAYLQHLKEHAAGPGEEKPRARYDIFAEEDMRGLLGSIALEQPWSAPHGTGEVAILHNRTVLHASYYREKDVKGYPIGVRYLE